MQQRPKGRIEDLAALRALYGEPGEIAVKKELDRLDRHCRAFIARSPFLCLASADGKGRADVSPKGDAPGFVQVVDDRTLLIPDRPGNNRLDSLSNILENPEVALIFFIPGVKETLRVNGCARIVADADVLRRLAVQGKVPKGAILVEVREAFMHCAKALARSRLWEKDYRIDRRELPSLAEMLADHAGDGTPVHEIAGLIEKSRKTRMY